MVIGDLTTMSVSYMLPGLNPAPVIVVDSVHAEIHRKWARDVRDNNTTAFFNGVLKEPLIRSANTRN